MPAQKNANKTRTPEDLLRDVFGYREFRPLQREVIDNVLARRDTLAIMPTGGGKSLCYQIPALLFPGLTVVVSPLISLMKDQVEQLSALGIPALFLNSSLEWDAYRENMSRIRQGKVRLLYVAPETLLTERISDLLENVQVDCLTVDEAHCISEWGHDFRPEYRQIARQRAKFGNAACLALTATATLQVRNDIQKTLSFKDARPFVASFDRPNLFLEVQVRQNALEQTTAFLRRFPDQSGIIYCFSRRQVEELSAALAQRGFSVRPYHAGLEDAVRHQNQEAFIRDDVQIIVATVAFGMGINKPNVRFVVHYDLPKNLESYYQEIGRAGRDGLPAHCLLLYSYGDTQKIEYFIQQKEEPERSHARTHLQAMVHYAENQGRCRRIPLLHYFGESYQRTNCGACDVCTQQTRLQTTSAQADLTEEVRLFFKAMRSTGERFGAGHLIEILTGKASEKVMRFGHETLPIFGQGREINEKAWMHLSRQLLNQGLVERTEYNGLQLSARGEEVIIHKKAVLGEPLVGGTRRKPAAGPSWLKDPDDAPKKPAYDTDLFERLRSKRKALADTEKVPAYVILPDRSLFEMAAATPLSLNSLKSIYGFGEVKLERYGQAFLGVIADYARERAAKQR